MNVAVVLATIILGLHVPQDPKSVQQMVLELPSEDPFSVSPEIVIKECSALLEQKGKLKPEIITKALKNRATAFLLTGKASLAEQDANELCQLHPKDPEIRLFRATVLERIGKSPEAMDEAQQALKLDPKNAFCHALIGFIHSRRGDFDKGIVAADKAIDLNPKCAWAYYCKAFI
jgi:Flp pilus assembly protein TadD